MPDIHIHRQHTLGLARARQIAWQWAEEVEAKFGMDCTVLEGETSDTVEFSAQRRQRRRWWWPPIISIWSAKLGFLLGAFSKTIEERDREATSMPCWAMPAVRQALPPRPAKKACTQGCQDSNSGQGG